MDNTNVKKTYQSQPSILNKTPFVKTKSFNNKADWDNKGKDNIYYNSYRGTTTKFGSLYLLAKWKGSVYRFIWHDLLIFLACYFGLALIYRMVLCNGDIADAIHKQRFELMCIYAERFSGAIPIALLTGFYVTSVVSRWWDQFMALPYPDKLALKLVAFVPGHVCIDINFSKEYIIIANTFKLP